MTAVVVVFRPVSVAVSQHMALVVVSSDSSDSSDPETFLEYLEEDHMIDGVEGAAQVELDQDTGMPATVHVAHYSVVDVDHDGFGRMVCAVGELTRWQQIVRFHVFIETYRHHSFDGLR